MSQSISVSVSVIVVIPIGRSARRLPYVIFAQFLHGFVQASLRRSRAPSWLSTIVATACLPPRVSTEQDDGRAITRPDGLRRGSSRRRPARRHLAGVSQQIPHAQAGPLPRPRSQPRGGKARSDRAPLRRFLTLPVDEELAGACRELPLRKVEPGDVLVRKGEPIRPRVRARAWLRTVARAGVTIAVISAPGSLVGEVAVLVGCAQRLGDGHRHDALHRPVAEEGEVLPPIHFRRSCCSWPGRVAGSGCRTWWAMLVELKVQYDNGPGSEGAIDRSWPDSPSGAAEAINDSSPNGTDPTAALIGGCSAVQVRRRRQVRSSPSSMWPTSQAQYRSEQGLRGCAGPGGHVEQGAAVPVASAGPCPSG